MKNPQPPSVYAATPTAAAPRGTVVSITYAVPSLSERGATRTVTVDPVDGVMRCTCPARRQCWHEKAVIAGLAGKPRVRVAPKPAIVAPAPRPAPRLADASATICGSVSDLDIYGDDTDRTALDRRLAAMRGAA